MPKQKDFTLTPEQQQTVLKYMPYADTISLLFRNRPADFDDIRQESYLGLCTAVIMYEGKNDATFETFSSQYIVGRIQRFIKRYSRTQILSLGDDEDDSPVQTEHAPSLTDICCVQTEHAPSLTDICCVQTEHAPSLTDTLNVDTQVITTTSLSKYDEDEGNLSFEETLPDPDSLVPDTQLNYKLLVERLTSILNERERKIVKCAFYIDRQSQIRLRIWQRFNLKKSRFYDIVDRAILKMAEYAFVNHIESPFN